MSLRISVVIPTYNRVELVTQAVASVLAQTTPEIEILVVDDGSSDGTVERLKTSFQAEVHQGIFKVIAASHSGDPGVNRNLGAREAKGEFVAFLDSDDVWLPGRIQWIQEKVAAGFDFILSCDGEVPSSTDWLAAFLRKNIGITSTAVVRKNLFWKMNGMPEGYYGPFKKAPIGWEDYELWLRCLLELQKTGNSSRIGIFKNHLVRCAETPQSVGSVGLKKQMGREFVTLLRVAPQLPVRYWPILLRRLAGAAKAIVLN